jgi:2-amino-4-hydroxy-6-hydroxymethyldihydropteridine diphosphokinase
VATAYIALGSNLGDRLGYLRSAVAALRNRRGIDAVVPSPVYETEAVASLPQPPYLNAVLRVATDLDPQALLALCLDVERALGRERPAGLTKAARTIDLDLLLLGPAIVEQPGLRLPHPGLEARPFVRIPLSQVAAPGLRHPLTGTDLTVAAPHPDVRPTSLSLGEAAP